jgi:RimJ/RimL family protein N-acetyltransferase
VISHPTILKSERVALIPLAQEHLAELHAQAQEPEIWQYFRAGSLAGYEELRQWVGEALRLRAVGIDYPFAVVEAGSGRVAGSTRFRLMDAANRSLEIGGTWLGREFRGTGLNREMKRLMLAYAFDQLGVLRVQFRTDLRNERSQRAIQGLGAQREGIFRKDFLYADGYQRTTVYYSITDEDWPQVRRRLESELDRERGNP